MEDSNQVMEGFYRLPIAERLARIKTHCGLTNEEVSLLSGETPLSPQIAEHLIENVIGYFPMPMGVATYFKIDGRDLFIPMVVEETSIIAAVSATAKWISQCGSIRTYVKGKMIIGQIQIPQLKDPERTRRAIHENRDLILGFANACVPGLVKRGGGVKDLVVRTLAENTVGMNPMLVIHVLCDPCDAMGANIINQVCEALKPKIEELTGEQVGLCILSNLLDTKMAGAEVVIRNVDPKLGHGIEEAVKFAKADPYRAATHNKGVLNGIDAVLVATGNDWRAVEAGIHAYAARSGCYQPVTDWFMAGKDLVGRIEVPLAVGTVGGVTRLHPTAQIGLKMLGIRESSDLARICAAVGLVQNLGALRALSTVGIVKGHMALHAANLAIAAGAEIHEITAVREKLVRVLKDEKSINVTRAKEILDDLRASRQNESSYHLN